MRHPAYWHLYNTEPDELMMRRYEQSGKHRSLTLWEYADLAYSLGSTSADREYAEALLPHYFSRLVHKDALLAKFDLLPLQDAYPALYVIGCLSQEQRRRLADGAIVPSFETRTNGRGPGTPLDAPVNCAPIVGAMLQPLYWKAPPIPPDFVWRGDGMWLSPGDSEIVVCFGNPPEAAASFRTHIPR